MAPYEALTSSVNWCAAVRAAEDHTTAMSRKLPSGARLPLPTSIPLVTLIEKA
jgi:hypothetical protein